MIIPLPAVALVLQRPRFPTVLPPPLSAVGLLAVGVTAPPPLVPVISVAAVVVVVVMVRAPVAITLPRVVGRPLPAMLRLPVPGGATGGGKAVLVRALVVLVVVSGVPSVTVPITHTLPLVTPVPVVSLSLSAAVRVQSVSLPVWVHVDFIASRTGLRLVLLRSLCASSGLCRQLAALWRISRFLHASADVLWRCGGPVGVWGAARRDG